MNILIAGASGGIGNYLSSQLDLEENTLFLTYNRSRNKIIPINRAKSIIIKCDFSNSIDVENLYSQIPSLDVLINTMGHVENNLICKMDELEWDRVISSNLKTVFLSCKYAYYKMSENSHIINISSILGTMGMIGASNYVAAKGAVEAFTKSFALECINKKRIFVNGIALGYFKTGLGLNLSEKIVKIIQEKIPIREFGDSEEIIKIVKYIISSNYLVGQIIHLNGGLRI